MNASQTDSPRVSPLMPGCPDVLTNLWNAMDDDYFNPYHRWGGREPEGYFSVCARRVNADDHRLLFHLGSEPNSTLHVVQGLGWDRHALGLSRRAPEPEETLRHPSIITKELTRLVTFPTGLELYLVDIPRPGEVRPDVLLYDFNILEQHYYAGHHFVESKPFDPSSDPYASLIPYLVTPRGNGDATWTFSPGEQEEGTDDE